MGWGSSAPVAVQTEAEAFWYLNLSVEQQAAYDKFRAHLEEKHMLHPGHDDKYTLLRFLKARQYDVQRATSMYTGMAKWRVAHKVDELQASFQFPEHDEVFKHYPHCLHKTDKFGRPVYVELLGQTVPHKILEVTTLERLLDYHLCEWEALERRVLPACSKLAGRPIITKTVILDIKGLSVKNFGPAAQRVLKAVALMDQDYYPEHLGQMFIINTPLFFRAIWACVNPLLEDRTRRKILILGTDYLPTLLQLVEPSSLPSQLGGTSLIANMQDEVGPWLDVAMEAESAPEHSKAADLSSPIATESAAALACSMQAVTIKADCGTDASQHKLHEAQDEKQPPIVYSSIASMPAIVGSGGGSAAAAAEVVAKPERALSE